MKKPTILIVIFEYKTKNINEHKKPKKFNLSFDNSYYYSTSENEINKYLIDTDINLQVIIMSSLEKKK